MEVLSVAAAQLVSIIYASSAERELSIEELKSLLTSIRRRNRERGITGMLLYRGGNFLQVIEGPDVVVDQLMGELKKDSRHKGIIVMRRKAIEEREFGEWQMAFRDLNGADLSQLEGYSRFMELSFSSPDFQSKPALAYQILTNFKRIVR